MPVSVTITDLLDYTDWERQRWLDWFRQHGAAALDVSAGPHGDGRFHTVGDLVRHVFSAEKRYVEKLSGRAMTDMAAVPATDFEALFDLGVQSRDDLRNFISALPSDQWDAMQHFTLFSSSLSATPKKIVLHILLHEIRHWAQIATTLRLNGMSCEFHDFLFSPVMGGEFRRLKRKNDG